MEQSDYHLVVQNYLEELRRAKKGEVASLSYIRNQLPDHPVVANGESFQVLVIGGTILRTAIVKRIGDSVEVLSVAEFKQPVFASEEIFLDFITDHIAPKIAYIAMSFAYPIKPIFADGVLDAKLIYGSKEHTFDGLDDKLIGKTLSAYIRDKWSQDVKVSLANDTICLLLSGLTKLPWDQVAAGIVGTGMNFALFDEQNLAINLESGNFSNFSIQNSTKSIDATTERPGHYFFEKEISGKYLYQHFNYLIKQKGFRHSPITDTSDLTNIVRENLPDVSAIALQVFERSASLTAAACVAISQFQGRDLTFVMQGSVFWKGYQYAELVTYAFSQLLPGKQFHYIQIDNADVLGAAKLIA